MPDRSIAYLFGISRVVWQLKYWCLFSSDSVVPTLDPRDVTAEDTAKVSDVDKLACQLCGCWSAHSGRGQLSLRPSWIYAVKAQISEYVHASDRTFIQLDRFGVHDEAEEQRTKRIGQTVPAFA